MACLKLWRRFTDPIWLERTRLLALHAAEQVEVADEVENLNTAKALGLSIPKVLVLSVDGVVQ